MSDTWGLENNALPAVANDYEKSILQTGQRIVYNGEEGRIVRISPFLVIKTKNRIICGALIKEIEPVRGSLQETV